MGRTSRGNSRGNDGREFRIGRAEKAHGRLIGVSELLKREDVSVDVENDVVVFRVGSNIARFSYTSAFMIAQQLRLAAGMAARIAGATLEQRRAIKRQPIEDDVRSIDAGNVPSGDLRWRVWTEGELVSFQIGDIVARWESPAAGTIAGWFREGGRQAKNWAGDTSKTMRLAGILTDAGENRRLGH